MTKAKPSFWGSVWERFKATMLWVATKILAPGVALILVVLAIVLAAVGLKEFNFGGLIARLMGKKDPGQTKIDTANSVDSERKGKDGKPLPPGQPDTKGDTQAVVVPLEEKDDHTVVVKSPTEDKPVEVPLPDGVKADEVDTVVVVQPTVTDVTVKDTSGVSVKKVDDLLSKYGGS